MPNLSVIVIVQPHADLALEQGLSALRRLAGQTSALEVLWVLRDAPDRSRPTVAQWSRRSDLALAPRSFESLAEACDVALSPWVALCDLTSLPPPEWLDALRARPADTADSEACVLALGTATAEPVSALRFGAVPPWHACALNMAALRASGLVADATLPAALAANVLLWRMLLRPGASIGILGMGGEPAGHAEPPTAFWRDRASYDATLQRAFVEPLSDVARDGAAAPVWLQRAVLQNLHWYFTVDGRQRAPTVIVDEALADRFHAHVRQAMEHIEPAAVCALDGVSVEVRHALLSYRAPELATGFAIDAYDHHQGLARLTYWIHGEPPIEAVVIDGGETKPVFAKLRACNYFRRRLLRQRIAWLPAAGAIGLVLKLDGVRVPVALGAQPFGVGDAADRAAPLVAGRAIPDVLSRARLQFPVGKGGQQPLPPGCAGWKVRLLKWLARFPLVRWRYRDAWVLIDREEDADDSAEHLYRWLRKHHPVINAWFMLRPDSPDWKRLQEEGFRLMPPGFARKLLLLNAAHILSTHTDYVFGGFDRRLYGDVMLWRSTFLHHGVIKDDLSHWLGPREFDFFVTSSPAEHASIVDDDTPYPFTDREVRRTGLPRHDRLFRFANEMLKTDVNYLLVMPTWRASLVDERAGDNGPADPMARFAASAYASRWRAFLNSPQLRALLRRSGLRLAFMPHPNAQPFLAAFDVPHDAEIVSVATSVVQQVFAKTALFVTDYTSVAFTMAFLRRPVVYYQFDRADFYSGGHNWRPGYFDYDRDGFGPVAVREVDLLEHLKRIIEQGCCPSAEHLRRMEVAMPDRDDGACQRVYQAILSLNAPHAGGQPATY